MQKEAFLCIGLPSQYPIDRILEHAEKK